MVVELIIKAKVLIKIDMLEDEGVVVRALELEVLDSRLETLVELLANIEVVENEGIVVRVPVLEGPGSEVGDGVAEWDVEAELELDRILDVEVTPDELMFLIFEVLDDIVMLNTGVEEVDGASRVLILTGMTLEDGDCVLAPAVDVLREQMETRID